MLGKEKPQFELYCEANVHGMMFSQAWHLMEDYRPKASPEEVALLNGEPQKTTTHTEATYKKRGSSGSQLIREHEHILCAMEQRMIALV